MRKYSFLTLSSFALIVTMLVLPQSGSAVVVDGVRDLDYGPALAVQTVETQFGDNFSELNAGSARVLNNTLYVMLTGNLEGNFNKLNIFIDSRPGGQNVIVGANNPLNDNWAAKYSGFTFDAGFAADYLFIMRNGGSQFDLDYTVVGGAANGFDSYGNVFGGSREGAATTIAGPNLGFTFDVAFNNSNVGGVLGGVNAANPLAALAVTTGIELGIPLAAIGNPGSGDTIRISAMINGSNHDYLSNQFLGGLPAPQGNLGGDGFGGFNGTVSQINLNNYAGNQYFAIVVPEPSSALLAVLGLVAFWASHRRN